MRTNFACTEFIRRVASSIGVPICSNAPKTVQIGNLLVNYTSPQEFVQNFCSVINDKCPDFLNEKSVLEVINILKQVPKREILALVHDSGNDHDDQKAGVIVATMMGLGSVDPHTFRFIGMSNPEGADANGTLKRYFQEYQLTVDESCFLTSFKATTLYKPENPFSPQSQKKDVLGDLPKHYDSKDRFNNPRILIESMLNNTKDKILFVGASAGEITNLFFNNKEQKAIQIAYQKSFEEVVPKNQKEALTIELKTKLHTTFQQKLKEELTENILTYIRPQFIDRNTNKPKRLHHLLIQIQGATASDPNSPGELLYTGQNQKFCSLYETNGQSITLDSYEEMKNKNVPALGILDAKILQEVLQPIFEFEINYCGTNPKIVITKDIQEKLGKTGFDVLANFVVENYMKDNMLASYPSILLNEKGMETFFPGVLSSQPGLSKTFSNNAHPFRTLLNLYSSSKAAGVPIETIVKERNTNPKDIIETSIKKISDHISNKNTILHDKNASLEKKIEFFFDAFYNEQVTMTPDWDPRKASGKNFGAQWEALTGNPKYPTLSDVKTHLMDMVKKGSSSPTFTEAFCLELLQVHADGICAQEKCIKERVKGTQEECYFAVNQVCNQKFTDLFSHAISINPYDLENLLQGLARELPEKIDFETVTKLLIIKDFFHTLIEVEKSFTT